MSRKYVSILVVLFILVTRLQAQVGGSAVYSFLNIPASARIAALGGTVIHVKDDDLNSALQNPAALNPSMSNYILFSGVSHVAGIRFGDAAFALPEIKKGRYGNFDAWMHYVSYGEFDEADVTGEIIGSFKAADYAFSLGWGYQLNRLFSVGANLKAVYGDYYVTSAFGMAADISAMLADTSSGWNATILIRNAGAQIRKFEKDSDEPFPAEAVLGIAKKFEHLPARLSLTYNHLEKYDLTYVDPNDSKNIDALTGDFKPEKISFFDKGVRHLTPAIEVLFSKNFNLRFAYNFQRRAELAVDTRRSTVGFSYGVGLKISKFIISYGRATWQLAGASNHFSLAANLNEFTKRR